VYAVQGMSIRLHMSQTFMLTVYIHLDGSRMANVFQTFPCRVEMDVVIRMKTVKRVHRIVEFLKLHNLLHPIHVQKTIININLKWDMI
jgi:flagellar motor switch protein FliG